MIFVRQKIHFYPLTVTINDRFQPILQKKSVFGHSQMDVKEVLLCTHITDATPRPPTFHQNQSYGAITPVVMNHGKFRCFIHNTGTKKVFYTCLNLALVNILY